MDDADEEEYFQYWSIKYYDNNEIYTRIYHKGSSDRSIESAKRNELIEFITDIYWANCRESADKIAKRCFGITEKEMEL